MNDKASLKQMLNQAEVWLRALEKSGCPGEFKAWSYHHGVLPRLMWPLLVYEVPLSTVGALARKIKVAVCPQKHLFDWPANDVSCGGVQNSKSPVSHDAVGQRGRGGPAGRHQHPDRMQVDSKQGTERGGVAAAIC